MALSNQHGHLVLATGNKSELAVGYSTIYGDSVGGFAPIKDVPKTLVWQLARWRNARRRGARRDAADPGELDHQAAVGRAAARPARHRLAARRTRCSTTCWTTTSSRTAGSASCSPPASTASWSSKVLRLVDTAEYKRRQYPPGPKISLQGVRPRPPAADHQPLARARDRTVADAARGTMEQSGDSSHGASRHPRRST